MKTITYKNLRAPLYFVNICYAILATAPSILTGRMLDDAITGLSRENFGRYAALTVLVILLILFFGWLKNRIKYEEMRGAREQLERMVFRHALRAEDSAEDITNTFDTEINLIINNYVIHNGEYILIFVPFLIALSYSVILTYQTMLMIAVGFVFVVLMNQVVLMPFSRHMRELSKENEKVNHVVSRYLGAIASIKIYGGRKYASSVISEVLSERNRKEAQKTGYMLVVETINCLFSTLLQLVPLAVLAGMVIASKVSVGTALSIMLLLEKIVSPIDQVAELKEDKASASDAIRHIQSLSAEEKESKGDGRLVSAENSVNIEIRNLRVRYGERVVIDGFSHSFFSGKKYLIVGKNGAGKSTLLKVLSGQIRDYEGNVLLNGTELREINRADLYDKIGILPQFAEIFQGTVEQNIVVSGMDDEEYLNQIINCLDLAEVVHARMDKKVTLSGGEKQRVAVARMLYHKKPAYLLDEVLCGLDMEQSRRLEKQILEQKDTLIIHVSHRTPVDIAGMYDEVVSVSQADFKEEG